jgi:hypothetical protein
MNQLNLFETRLQGFHAMTYNFDATPEDIEELIIRNTYVNTLPIKNVVIIKNLKLRGIKWADDNKNRKELLCTYNNKDLFNQKDIKPIVSNKDMKPKKSILKIKKSISPKIEKEIVNLDETSKPNSQAEVSNLIFEPNLNMMNIKNLYNPELKESFTGVTSKSTNTNINNPSSRTSNKSGVNNFNKTNKSVFFI